MATATTTMPATTTAPTTAPQKSILVVSLARHITGESVKEVIAQDWTRFPDQVDKFESVGFDFDPLEVDRDITELKKTIKSRDWDAILLGWCMRGHQEFTDVFQRTVAAVVEVGQGSKLVFNTGATDVAAATIRNLE